MAICNDSVNLAWIEYKETVNYISFNIFWHNWHNWLAWKFPPNKKVWITLALNVLLVISMQVTQRIFKSISQKVNTGQTFGFKFEKHFVILVLYSLSSNCLVCELWCKFNEALNLVLLRSDLFFVSRYIIIKSWCQICILHLQIGSYIKLK